MSNAEAGVDLKGQRINMLFVFLEQRFDSEFLNINIGVHNSS